MAELISAGLQDDLEKLGSLFPQEEFSDERLKELTTKYEDIQKELEWRALDAMPDTSVSVIEKWMNDPNSKLIGNLGSLMRTSTTLFESLKGVRNLDESFYENVFDKRTANITNDELITLFVDLNLMQKCVDDVTRAETEENKLGDYVDCLFKESEKISTKIVDKIKSLFPEKLMSAGAKTRGRSLPRRTSENANRCCQFTAFIELVKRATVFVFGIVTWFPRKFLYEVGVVSGLLIPDLVTLFQLSGPAYFRSTTSWTLMRDLHFPTYITKFIDTMRSCWWIVSALVAGLIMFFEFFISLLYPVGNTLSQAAYQYCEEFGMQTMDTAIDSLTNLTGEILRAPIRADQLPGNIVSRWLFAFQTLIGAGFRTFTSLGITINLMIIVGFAALFFVRKQASRVGEYIQRIFTEGSSAEAVREEQKYAKAVAQLTGEIADKEEDLDSALTTSSSTSTNSRTDQQNRSRALVAANNGRFRARGRSPPRPPAEQFHPLTMSGFGGPVTRSKTSGK